METREGGGQKKVFKMNRYYKEDYQEGRNAEEIKGKFIFTLTLESLFADAPKWKKKRRMDLNTNGIVLAPLSGEIFCFFNSFFPPEPEEYR